MKTIVMMRGPQAERTELARKILASLNTDVDNVRGFMIQASDWMGRGRDQSDDESAAYTTCKNYLKKFMTHMNETVLIVNNPNEKPDTWRSYKAICAKFHGGADSARFVGVDLGDPTDEFRKEMDELHDGAMDLGKFAERFAF